MKCCICGKEIKGYSNNPAPIAGRECCDECNNNVIVPYRVFLSTLGKKNLAILITQNEVRLIQPNDKYFTLKELQTAVEGHIELAPRVFDDFLTVVNEEGLIYNLPFNELAFKMFEVEYYGNVLIVPRDIFEKPEE